MSIDFNSSSGKSEEQKILELWATNQDMFDTNFFKTLKLGCFRSFYWLFPSADKEKSQRLNHLKLEILNLALETFILISFLIPEETMESSSDTFHYIWIYISYLRLEKFFGVLGLFNAWIIFLLCVLAIKITALCWLFYKSTQGKQIKFKHARLLMILPMEFMVSFCMPSIFSTLYVLAKYASDSAPVYIKEIEFELQYTSPYISAVSVIMIIYFFLFTTLIRLMKTETRHDLFKFIPMARVNSRLDIMKSLYVNCLLISYYFISQTYPWGHIVIAMIGSLICWFLYFIQHPFYNPNINSIFANQFTVLFMISVAQLIGYAQGDPKVTFLLSLLVTPLVMVLSHVILKQKILQIQTQLMRELDTIKKERECEFVLRKYIIDENPEITQVFSKLYENQYLSKSKLVFIMDSYYTYNILGDKPLARIKLSFANGCPSSFYLDYQEFKCRRLIESDETTETLTYMKFASTMLRIKQKDQTLCRVLDDIWTELSLKTPSAQKIRKLIIQCKDLITFVLSKYAKLISKYPTQYYVYELYGSLCLNICNDIPLANNYIQRALQIKEDLARSGSYNSLNIFNPATGIIIISCHPDYFAKITFANSRALEILKYTNSSFIGYSLSDIIPEPYASTHNELLLKFIKRRESTLLTLHSDVIYLKASDEFLIPVTCKIRADAYGSYSCLLITINSYTKQFDIALLDEAGFIYNHSRDFAKNFEVLDCSLKGINMNQLASDSEMKYLTPIELMNRKKLILFQQMYGEKLINFAIVYNSLDDIIDLEILKTDEFIKMKSVLKKGSYISSSLRSLNLKRNVKIDDEPDVIVLEKPEVLQEFKSKRSRIRNNYELDMKPSSRVDHTSSQGTSSKSRSRSTFELNNRNFITNVQNSIKNLKICTGFGVISNTDARSNIC